MQVPFVDIRAQYQAVKTEILDAVNAVLEESVFVGGPRIKAFENAFGSLYGARNVVAVGNGTDAIYIALKMLGIGPGDEVITTAMSWISTSETITQTGATPVFVDVVPDTCTIDPGKIEEKITGKTKAILPVHLYGHMADMKKISALCRHHNLFLVEDCAQAHFSSHDNILAGMSGAAGTFSFYPSKNLGAFGDAGAIITADDDLARRMRMFANHGALVKHEHHMEGINSRLDTLQAAILQVKLRYIKQWTERRIEHANQYREQLSSVKKIRFPMVLPGYVHTYHLYVIQCAERDRLKKYLDDHGIQTAIHYPTALPNLPAYRHLGNSPSDFPVASRLQGEILSLPMYPELEKSQIDYVCERIHAFFKE